MTIPPQAAFEHFIQTGRLDYVPRTGESVDHDLVHRLSDKTGLSVFVVAELLYRGWRYVENMGEIPRWEHPMWNLAPPH